MNNIKTILFLLALVCSFFIVFSQQTKVVKKDSLLIVKQNPAKGFYNDYILFIPKRTPPNKKIFLLVEPNNTGKLSDSIEVHTQHAIALASVSSVGNNIATELHIPLLVPIFPRPASQPLTYTHALDRDVMLEKSARLKRLDLQLLQMISDAKTVLASMNIQVDAKIFMNGFSASATFANRFSFLHPGIIKALAIGGFNGKLMLPQKKLNGIELNYPIGINDLHRFTARGFDSTFYKAIPQFIYMGRLDDNDAVQFDDAYSKKERNIINNNIGNNVQDRYLRCQEIYKPNNIKSIFSHTTISSTGQQVILI